MDFTFQINTLLPLAALIISLVLSILALQYSSRRLMAIFIMLMLAISWWSLASILENAGLALSTKIFWLKVTYFGIVSIPVFWIIFTGNYSGGRKWLTRRNVVLLGILPVITLLMVWTNDIHHLMWKDIWLNESVSPAVDSVSHGAWFWIHSTYSYSLLAIGVFYLIRAYQQSDGIYRKQAGLLIIAGLIPWIGNFLFIAGVGPFALVDPTPLAFAITGTAFLFGLSRLQLLDLTPVAQGEVFKSMADGVIVIDNNQRITDINPAILSIFEIHKSSVVGQPYNLIMPGLAGLLDTKDAGLAEIELQIGGLENRRYYTATMSPIQAGSRINGHVILMRDDTNRRKAEVEYRERIRLETELTERKKAEEQIKHLASFPDSNPNPVTELSYEGKILYSNPAAWRSFPDLESVGLGHPYLAGWQAIADELKNGPIKQMEREVSVGNNYFDQTIQFLDHQDIYRIYGRNITGRKLMEVKLQKEERKLKELAESISDVFFAMDDNLKYTYWNRASEELTGVLAKDAIGKTLAEIFPENEAREQVTSMYLRAMKTKQPQHFTVNYPGGEHLVHEISAYPSEEGITVFIKDITAIKQAEVENQQLREKAEVSSRLAAVGEMAAGIAHEINNPLTAVIGFSELLMEADLPQEIKAELKIIGDGGKRVKDIVKRMLTFARQTEAIKSWANINELVDATLDLRSYVLRTANIEVVKHLDPDLPSVLVDSGQLQQVFLNLIVNAEYSMKKAHDKGTLTITTKKKDDHIRISFKDDGMGISKETKEKLFNPFFTTKEVNEGTGLGLSLSHSIILEHGGTIEVESEPGKGATFIIILPVNQTSCNVTAKKLAESINVSPENHRTAHILVVDDEEAIRKLLSILLVQNGHTVEVTGDYLDVFEYLRKNKYDAILMDIRMPGMSGIEQYELIIKEYPALVGKFIFITGDTSDSGTRAFLEQNSLGYISKPFDRETLIEKLNNLLY